MQMKEIKYNLFDVDQSKYYFAHCISLDCAMGQGIASSFCNKEPQIKEELIKTINNNSITYPFTILYVGENMKVFNLITKKTFNFKPTYSSIYECIKQMKDICKRENVSHLAMPKIGCGKDRLEWKEISFMLKEEFKDLDIEILICY